MNNHISQKKFNNFQTIILDYYHNHGRQFAWRNTSNPYHILVSEIMLQQTQTYRVAPKYDLFIQRFPTIQSLAQAPLVDILQAWQGLGYNRRGLALQKCAQKVIDEFNGLIPTNPKTLMTFPGIGKATAASICAFAFNMPTIFIETNIRAVFIHFFFQGKTNIHDNELFPLIEKTIYKENPRIWYYALMDYGVMLKKECKNPSRASKHHIKQTTFEGSNRQLRGLILKLLTVQKIASFDAICSFVPRKPELIKKALDALYTEGFLKQNKNFFSIT